MILFKNKETSSFSQKENQTIDNTKFAFLIGNTQLGLNSSVTYRIRQTLFSCLYTAPPALSLDQGSVAIYHEGVC